MNRTTATASAGRVVLDSAKFDQKVQAIAQAILKEFQKDLSDYKTSKGAIQFPLDRPIPFGLITKILLVFRLINVAPINDVLGCCFSQKNVCVKL